MIWRTAFWFVLVAAIADKASANQLLFALQDNPNGRHVPAYAPQGLRFAIEFQSPHDAPNLERVGDAAYWPDGSSGSYDFVANSHMEAMDLIDVLTNGVDDDIGSMTYDNFYGGNGLGAPESFWGFGNPDLAGNQIDFIRLVVHDLSIQPYSNPPYGEGLQWNGDITWEFWGTPLPEPATTLPILLTVLLWRRKRRKGSL